MRDLPITLNPGCYDQSAGLGGHRKVPHQRPSCPLQRPDRQRSPTERCRRVQARLPDLYLNPHLSLLAFQRRVLEEAQDRANPLLERWESSFSILGSNIDEFFMVRVAGLWRRDRDPHHGDKVLTGGLLLSNWN